MATTKLGDAWCVWFVAPDRSLAVREIRTPTATIRTWGTPLRVLELTYPDYAELLHKADRELADMIRWDTRPEPKPQGANVSRFPAPKAEGA